MPWSSPPAPPLVLAPLVPLPNSPLTPPSYDDQQRTTPAASSAHIVARVAASAVIDVREVTRRGRFCCSWWMPA